jgi:NADPH:quinone reductase
LGADATVDYTQPGWIEAVKEATGGRGADIILDMAGGRISEQSLDALAPFGRMIVYGLASGEPVSVNPTRLLYTNQTITGFGLADWFGRPDLIQERLGEIIGHVLSGRLKLSIDHILPLAEAAEAHRILEARQTTGKIVLIP